MTTDIHRLAGAVVLERFSAWFGSTPALHNIDLAVRPQSVTALIGPSGSGKSTLLRAINRLNEALPGARSSGRLLLDGVNVYEPTVDLSELRQRVGMVFQRSNPFPRSVFDNVAYGPRLNAGLEGRALDDTVEDALRRAALWDEVKDRLRENALTLSGGQQQRLCIARALANRPAVLLLDEPTSALDPQATQRIEELLYDLQPDLTIVIVTHNLHQAARVSRRTALLIDGVLVEETATDQLFTRPSDSRTEAFITGRFG
ncbi:phosphate ABC transporter ATP-binding protein PstB [Gemmatimonas sp.]|uniref:phosphate ABC transporter ATP-binding protein PstB n=1 Tax=Gemmatimonas sp. TaxID=1962908 RepID=UPI0039832F61